MPAPFRLPFLKSQVERDLDRELANHIELKIAALQQRGLSAEEARREAIRLFGDAVQIREESLDIDLGAFRNAARWNAFAEITQDAWFAVRTLQRHAQSTLAIVLILALGIGATTSVFSLYNTVVLSPLSVSDPSRLVWIENNRRDAGDGDVTTGAYFAWKDASQTLKSLATIANTSATLVGVGAPSRLEGAVVGNGLLSALEIRAELGRSFADRDFEPNETPVVMLSRKLWQSRFHGDSSIIGKNITLDGVLRSVIGVMPPSADLFDDGVEFWLPSRLATGRANFVTPRLQVIGLLKPGATVASAASELTKLLAAADTRPDRVTEAVTARVVRLDQHLGGAFRSRLLLLFAAVACVLAVGCANVASLLLVQGITRNRELAIRASLGAGRARLVRQLLTENVLIGATGGVLGLGFAIALLALLKKALPAGIPHLDNATINGEAALFSMLVTFACCVLVGLIPALRLSRIDVRSALQSGARGTIGSGDRLRRLLMVAEVCLATVLLITAGMLTRSATKLDRVPLGFDAHDVLTARVSLPGDKYDTPSAVVAANTRLLAELRAENAPAPVALVSRIPLVSLGISYDFGIADKAVDKNNTVNAAIVLASSDYFRTMRMQLSSGRDFNDRDETNSPRVAIVNAAMARKLQLGDRVVGSRVTGLGEAFNDKSGSAAPWEIIGVAADTRDWGSRNDTRPQIYLPYTQTPDELWMWTNRTSVIVAQSSTTEAATVLRLRNAVQRVDATLPLYDVQSMSARVRDANATERAYTILLIALGSAALLLAAAGIYGMLSYAVRQRVPEFGVRVALGATPSHILSLVLRWALRLTITGIALGFAASLMVTPLLRTMLFGVGFTDAATLAIAGTVMILTALATSIIPARRALAITPDQAIRGDG
ncbi:MAG: ABC transporter permease [Gemmatimonadaceae bacterium]